MEDRVEILGKKGAEGLSREKEDKKASKMGVFFLKTQTRKIRDATRGA